jgi:hypothetical protein
MTDRQSSIIVIRGLLIFDATLVVVGLICQLSERAASSGQFLIFTGLPLLVITSIGYLIAKKRGMF